MTPEEQREKIGNRQYLTPNEVALMLGRNRSTIKRWINHHGLPVHNIRGQRYVLRRELDDWHEARHAHNSSAPSAPPAC